MLKFNTIKSYQFRLRLVQKSVLDPFSAEQEAAFNRDL